MSDATPQFPVGTIVVLTAASQATSPASFHTGDELTIESTTGGKSAGRVMAVSPERIEVTSDASRYSLSPTAATLEEGGATSYDGGWVVRSIAGA